MIHVRGRGDDMDESILDSVKKIIGIDSEYDVFDTDLIIHINSVFMILNQLGVGPKEVFSISNASTTWSEFIRGNNAIQAVKSYMALRVRMLFDKPQNGTLIDAYQKDIDELEWRLYVACDSQRIDAEGET